MTSGRFFAIVIGVLLSTFSLSARAFFDPPWITPAAPRAGESVSVNIRGGECDSIFEHPGYPQITQQGSAIRLLEYGHHWDTTDLCIYPIGTLTEALGPLPSGDYTLTVDFIYNDYLFGPTTINLGVVQFTVTGATTVEAIPAFDSFGGIALLLLIAGVAVSRLRHRMIF
jgi:hypothetical protein